MDKFRTYSTLNSEGVDIYYKVFYTGNVSTFFTGVLKLWKIIKLSSAAICGLLRKRGV